MRLKGKAIQMQGAKGIVQRVLRPKKPNSPYSLRYAAVHMFHVEQEIGGVNNK